YSGSNVCGTVGLHYVVQVANQPVTCSGGNCEAGQVFAGVWNETILTWAPQVVNFALPAIFLGPYIPQTVDFSNAPSGYGSISYVQTFTTTETLAHEWSVTGGAVVIGGASGSTSVTQSVASGGGPTSSVGGLDWGGEWNMTGTAFFNAVDRTWNVTSMSTVGHAEKDGYSSAFGAAMPPDDFEPGELPSGAYYLKDSDGVTMQDYPEPAGKGYTGSVETSSTTAISAGISIGFSLSATLLPGAPPISFDGSTGWTQTSSTTYTQDLQFQIGGANASCYDVFGEGGSSTANPETADLIGVYYWTPTDGTC
ncbi:MAG: hypothetical protein WBE40_04575, partial [Thermoplasmata archaeon]